MSNMGVMRARCYLILAGLERSIGESLSRNFEVTSPSFLQPEESERALWRLREDMQDQAWTLQDVGNVDLLPYLDLGDLLGLCNRHKSTVRNAQPAEVEVVTKVIQEYGTHAIRKRVMHPVRPLEAGDYNALLTLAQKLPDESPSLSWEPLVESVSLIEDPRNIADTALPRFWMDESRTVNNLPVPEFEDTGFIGRADERRRLKTLILSDHKVITVVGAGGIGKTALAMRVCHDILDDTSTRFDNVIWVSLKTQFLTGDGIRHIRDAVDTQSKLLDHIATSANIPIDQRAIINWAPVVDHMSRYKTLLVIDNLETLGTELKELAFEVPQGSKLLLTSRVGLGEIERRFDIPDFSAHDSEILMRVLGNAYGYSEIKQLVLQRRVKVAAPSCLRGGWSGVSRGNGEPVRCVAAYPPATTAMIGPELLPGQHLPHHLVHLWPRDPGHLFPPNPAAGPAGTLHPAGIGHVVMPPRPGASLVLVQTHVALLRLELRFYTPPGPSHVGQGLQGSVLRSIGPVVAGLAAVQVPAPDGPVDVAGLPPAGWTHPLGAEPVAARPLASPWATVISRQGSLRQFIAALLHGPPLSGHELRLAGRPNPGYSGLVQAGSKGQTVVPPGTSST